MACKPVPLPQALLDPPAVATGCGYPCLQSWASGGFNGAYFKWAEMTKTPIGLLRWRCRRGMRELDVLLERYLREGYPCAPEREQQAFEALLELPDPQLHAYLVRREAPDDPEWLHVIDKLSDAHG